MLLPERGGCSGVVPQVDALKDRTTMHTQGRQPQRPAYASVGGVQHIVRNILENAHLSARLQVARVEGPVKARRKVAVRVDRRQRCTGQ